MDIRPIRKTIPGLRFASSGCLLVDSHAKRLSMSWSERLSWKVSPWMGVLMLSKSLPSGSAKNAGRRDHGRSQNTRKQNRHPPQ